MSTRRIAKGAAKPVLRGPKVQYPDGRVVTPPPLDLERILADLERLEDSERVAFLCIIAHSLTVDIRALLLDRPVSDRDLDRVNHVNEFLHQLTSCVNPWQRRSASGDAGLVRAIIDTSYLYGLEAAAGRALATAAGNTIGRDKRKVTAPDLNVFHERTNMEKFTELSGIAAPLPMINVDTDKIIPARFLRTIERTGLGKMLFNEMRYQSDGSENPDFVLNQPPYRKAQILVAGANFGCGSSREHAPWALLDFGISCVIAASFADIFYNNCFKNGVLPIALPKEIVDELMEDAEKGANAVMTIDLESQTITRPDGGKVHFELDGFRKHCLLNGLDDIGLTEQKGREIAAYEEKARLARPWQFGMIRPGA